MQATDGELNILALQSSHSMVDIWSSIPCDLWDEWDMAEGEPGGLEDEVSLSPALKKLLDEMGLDASKTVTMKHSRQGGLCVVKASCALNRETRETVKLARSSRGEATEAADRKLVAVLRRRYFPAQVMASVMLIYDSTFDILVFSSSGGSFSI